MVTLYTIHCPKCNVLQKKMEQKGIEYTAVENIEEIQKLGFTQLPILNVDGVNYDFSKAVSWINAYQGKDNPIREISKIKII